MQIAKAANRVQSLPGRFGPRPRNSGRLPFRQVDQFPPPHIHGQLVQLGSSLPLVHTRQSRLAPPDCHALCVGDLLASGPAEAFIDGHEFCHLHPLPDGSIHLTLPAHMIHRAAALGWLERHPLRRLGVMKMLVLVYAPRDARELDVVAGLIECGRQFAMGAAMGVDIARGGA